MFSIITGGAKFVTFLRRDYSSFVRILSDRLTRSLSSCIDNLASFCWQIIIRDHGVGNISRGICFNLFILHLNPFISRIDTPVFRELSMFKIKFKFLSDLCDLCSSSIYLSHLEKKYF